MASNRITHALVRPPGDSFVNAISSRRTPIDVPLARAQHSEYCQALTAAGLVLETLPPDERYPDSCFVQDPAILVGGMAVIARLSAPSRAGEETAIADWLGERFSLAHINAPGTLEGGDVLLLPGRVLVGASGRTNSAGIDQLAEILASVGLAVSSLLVMGYLHLLTAVSFLGQNTLLATADFVGHPAFEGFDAIVVAAGRVLCRQRARAWRTHCYPGRLPAHCTGAAGARFFSASGAIIAVCGRGRWCDLPFARVVKDRREIKRIDYASIKIFAWST